jgi:4-hydroxy-2-oxoheptanedioate aldolase
MATMHQAWLRIPSTLVAEVALSAGYDSLGIDFQHGFFRQDDVRTLAGLCAAVGARLFARVDPGNYGLAGMLADNGVAGIIAPDVRSGEEAEEYVRALRYPPTGRRSFAPATGLTNSTDDPQLVVQVESEEGMARIDEICGTVGVWSLFPGLVDLGLDGGVAPSEQTMPWKLERLRACRRACDDHGLQLGAAFATSGELNAVAGEVSIDWVQYGSDLVWMTRAAHAARREFGEIFEQR